MKISRRKFTLAMLCCSALSAIPFAQRFITVKRGWVVRNDD